MTQGIFVRACPVCSKLHQTHDQLGKTPCGDKCKAKLAARQKGQPAPPEPEPNPEPEESEPETVEDLLPAS